MVFIAAFIYFENDKQQMKCHMMVKKAFLNRAFFFAIIIAYGIPFLHAKPVSKRTYTADIIVYGGTSSAVIAAVQAKRMGKSVMIVSPDIHLGGLSSGGLGFTDTGNKEVIGGLAREFYHRVFLHYQHDSAWVWQRKEEYGNKGQGTPAIDGKDRTMWIFEPHVAENIFEEFIKENDIRVFRNAWLNRNSGVKKTAGKIVSISTMNGATFIGKVFIDATYEGDLMAASGVSYHVGREAKTVYGEEWNGIQTGILHHGHHFKFNVDPYKIPGQSSSGLLYGVSNAPPGQRGDGDKRVQAYCYRMCLTKHPDNKVPFSKPAIYEPAKYELLIRIFSGGWRELFQKFDLIPNKKTDVNNHGPFSTDNIGMNYDYPDASYKRRREIIAEHENYQKGLMYFLATDPRVPDSLQKEFNTWGLAKDEFKDNGNWPHQLYVREARRMLSDYVLTENVTLGKKTVNNPVGMGSYTLDSHNTQRYIKPDGFVQNEGDIGVNAPKPYAISYQALVPKERECKNLLVSVCISSSHIAYGSIRMEPVFMILGESTATAASVAIDKKVSVQKVDYITLKHYLLNQKQKLGIY